MKLLSTILIAASLLQSIATAASEISSPDKRIVVRTQAEENKVSYSVEFNGKPIIAKSQLGVHLNKDVFSSGVTLTASKVTTFDETWKSVWGQTNEHRNHYNELTLDLTEAAKPNRKMQVLLRAYNDGIAFRYIYPEQENLEKADLKKELSQVSLISKFPLAWWCKNDTTLFSNVAFNDIKKPCRTPFTAQLAHDCFVSLHEAAVLNSSDANLFLGKDKRTLTYSSQCKQGTGTVSAWRTIQIASNAAGLIESSLLLNLNEPNKLADTSWIKPGVSLWDWRCHGGKADDGFVYGINTESYIRYIDFAHKNNIPYLIIDAEWYGPERDIKSDPITYEHEVDMPKVTSHAKEKGVGIWLYINDKALKHFDMDRTFAQYQKWGIAGIKHGFLGGGSQSKNAFSVEVLKKCAEYKIMYNLHEPNKPTGIRRTYPHYISREYVNSMLDALTRKPATPTELCIFPVVHNLAGPVDRSCGLFDMDQSIARDKVHKQIPSTVASQVAQCLIFPSGILTLPDMPDAYNRKMDLFQFIKQLPMTYDDTKVLELEIGKHITMARRSGDTWFVAALANESGRKLETKLDFLKPGITYDITLYEDTAESHYQYPGGWNKRDAAKKKIPFKPVKTKRELYQVRKMTLQKGDTISAIIAPRRRPWHVDSPSEVMHNFGSIKRQLIGALISLIAVSAKQPNIIFIMADDLGMQDVGFMGSTFFETPNLDALASESLVFENAYMYPTCSPSRAALLTGKQSFRTGCYTVPVLEKGTNKDNIFSKWTVGAEHPVYSQPLNDAGYKLIHLGKWHIVGPNPAKEILPLKKKLGQPKNGDLSWLPAHQSPAIQKFYPIGRGFHENVGGTWWGDPARGYDKGYNAPSGGYFAPFKNPFITDKKDDEWLTDRLTSDAINFIGRHKEKPFFINLHYYSPHRPSVSRSEKSLTHFSNKKGDPITGQGVSIKKKGKGEIAAYATMIKSLDDNIKRLTDYLDQAGLRENTVLIFTSDNGFNGLQSRNNLLRGNKGYIYEGGIRVPALINWPKTVAPSRRTEPIQGLDYFPTFLDLAGVTDFKGRLDGNSLVPLLKGQTLKERPLFWHLASTYKNPPCSVIRKGDWKTHPIPQRRKNRTL